MRKAVNTARDIEIAAERASGGSLRSIAAKYGVTKQRVYQISKKAGFVSHREDKNAKARDLCADGKTTREVAEALGVTPGSARRRIRQAGAVPNPQPKPSTWDRLANRIAFASGCWMWLGAKSRGYGRANNGPRTIPAHKIVYEQLVGDVPSGLVLDHLCREPSCVNPQHLEPVSNEENVRRGLHPRKTHCLRGHAIDDGGKQWATRRCIQCQKLHDATRRR